MDAATVVSASIDISDLFNIDFDEIVSEELQDTADAIFVDLTAPPPLGTPFDLGTARNGWQKDYANKLAPEIYNDVPYIGRLNNGHSKQSPAGFVEAVIDKHLR